MEPEDWWCRWVFVIDPVQDLAQDLGLGAVKTLHYGSATSLSSRTNIRGTMIFAWCLACLADTLAAFNYHRKPLL